MSEENKANGKLSLDAWLRRLPPGSKLHMITPKGEKIPIGTVPEAKPATYREFLHQELNSGDPKRRQKAMRIIDILTESRDKRRKKDT